MRLRLKYVLPIVQVVLVFLLLYLSDAWSLNQRRLGSDMPGQGPTYDLMLAINAPLAIVATFVAKFVSRPWNRALYAIFVALFWYWAVLNFENWKANKALVTFRHEVLRTIVDLWMLFSGILIASDLLFQTLRTQAIEMFVLGLREPTHMIHSYLGSWLQSLPAVVLFAGWAFVLIVVSLRDLNQFPSLVSDGPENESASRVEGWNWSGARILGFILLLCAFYQIGIYLFPEIFPSPSSYDDPTGYERYRNIVWSAFGNPRIGFLLFRFFDFFYWISAVWLFGVAVLVVAKPDKPIFLRAYLVAELAMVVTAAIYILKTVFQVSFTYRFSSDIQLQVQMVVLFGFSVVPCVFALTLLGDAKLALKLIVTVALSVLACPAGVLLGFFMGALLAKTPISGRAFLHILDSLLNLGYVLPYVVLLYGIRRSFKTAQLPEASMPSEVAQ